MEARSSKKRRSPALNTLRSQFTQRTKKALSKEAGTHRYNAPNEPQKRQVVSASEEIITHKLVSYYPMKEPEKC